MNTKETFGNNEAAVLLGDLPVYGSGADIGVFDCGEGVWQRIYACTQEAAAEKYVSELQAAGFALLSVNRKGVNVFWQLKNDSKVLLVSYVPAEGYLRVIAESAETAVISGVKEENYKSLYRTQITQIGLSCDEEGLHNYLNRSYDVSIANVVRLCDGSFIVYDGGMPFSEHAHRLYTVLKSQTELGKPIVIAAWVLTHPHFDHTGVFELFTQEYADKVKVENIVLNFSPVTLYTDGGYPARILELVKNYAGARVMKVYAGTDLYFRNVKMEVLFEQTLNPPKLIKNINAETLVTRLEWDGKSFMMFADHADFEGNERYPAGNFNNGAIRRMYGDYLKSDVVQVAHHGLGGGGTAALYELVDAKYALWPVSEQKYNRHKLGEGGVNAWFRRDDVKTFLSFDKLQILYVENGEIRWQEYDSYADYEKAESAVPNTILPRVKSQQEQAGRWLPQRKIAFSVAEGDTFGQNAVKAAGYFLPSHVILTEEKAEVVLKKLDTAPKAEWYRLTATSQGVTLEYADARGAVNAMASLAQMILDGIVHSCVIEDYPDYPFRGLMLDLARGIREPFQDVKDVVVHMALSKYNCLQLYLLDDGLAYASDVVPALKGSKLRGGRQYSKKQIRELVALCEIFAMEVIPMLQIPAHAMGVLAAFPQFACEVPDDHTSKYCLCPGSDGLFEMYEKLIRETCELFPGKYFHIGGDELEFSRQPELNQLCYWRECPKCQRLREEKGLADIREQFYYVVMRVYEMVKANGKTMMMWNDQIDISKDCPLPKDILIQFWRVAGAGRGPVEGCSMEGFARQGYEIVNSTFPKTYIDFDSYLKEGELCNWTPVSEPDIYAEGHKYVQGSMMCAWEYGKREQYSFYDYTIQPSLPLFADRLWCSEPVSYDRAYRECVYKLMFGRKMTCDLYEVFGAIIPPRMAEAGVALAYKKPEDIDGNYLSACIDEIAKPCEGGIYQNMRMQYVKLLQNIALLKSEDAAPVINVDK